MQQCQYGIMLHNMASAKNGIKLLVHHFPVVISYKKDVTVNMLLQ
jgi:hypothetical protein